MQIDKTCNMPLDLGLGEGKYKLKPNISFKTKYFI
jgi:hypothetical protein